MTEALIGRLERVDLRTVWTSESSGFTPWLALPENLAVLSETLDLELEFEGREKAVGRFSADIRCKELGTDHWVLIENQLERTDHCDLGRPPHICRRASSRGSPRSPPACPTGRH